MSAPSLSTLLMAQKPRRRKRQQKESQHQRALFEWARLPAVLRSMPELHLLEGSMNGVPLPPAVAALAWANGMLKGQHDVRLPVARGRWIGLSIELKVEDNRPSPDQLRIGGLLEAEGWKVHYEWDWEDARRRIIEYLNLPKPSVIEAS